MSCRFAVTLKMMSIPLEPDESQREELAAGILSFLDKWHQNAAEMPALGDDIAPDLIEALMRPPEETGRPLEMILRDVDDAGESGLYHPSGGHMSYIPNAGLYSGALADLLASGLNRYTGITRAAPGMAAIEAGVVKWMLSLFEFGEHSAGQLLSGGSMANFTGIAAARTARLGLEFGRGVIYVTSHTHHSVSKAAHLVGTGESQIRIVPVDAGLRMDLNSLRLLIADDRAAGLIPYLLVGSAGTTDTGTVEYLSELADLAEEQKLWFHVDAAYGGFFQLTRRGRAVMQGIERADSIVLDPHKGLSIPFGVGAILVRNQDHLVDANRGRGAYLLTDDVYMGLRDNASLGPELSRPNRGLQVWLPLQLHGVAAFRDALDSSLDLAEVAYERLSGISGLETPWKPDLSIVAFRFEDDDVGRAAMQAINEDRRVHVSSTTIEERFVLRFAILNRRTTESHIHHAIDIIEKTLAG